MKTKPKTPLKTKPNSTRKKSSHKAAPKTVEESRAALAADESMLDQVQRAVQHWKWRLLNMRLKECTTRLAAFALGFLALAGVTRAAESKGYFLDFAQKGELIARGEITDANENVYDVRIVPGYMPAIEDAGDQLAESGDAIARYATSEPWAAMGESYADGAEFVADDVVSKFWIDGIGEEWIESMDRAAKATEVQSFGWPLAYPAAVTKSTGETVGRLALGVVGIGGGSAYSFAAEPTYHLLEPGVEGVGRLAFGGIVIPTARIALNTAVAPPLALIGRKPAPERADGFFVRIVSGPDAPKAEMPEAEAPVEAEPEPKVLEYRELSSNSVYVDEAGGCCMFVNEMMRDYAAVAVIRASSQMPN